MVSHARRLQFSAPLLHNPQILWNRSSHTQPSMSYSEKNTECIGMSVVGFGYVYPLPLKDKQNTDPCNNNHSSQHSGSVGCKQPLWPFLQNKETSSVTLPQFTDHKMCSYLNSIFVDTANVDTKKCYVNQNGGQVRLF